MKGSRRLKIATTDGEALAALAGAYARSQGIVRYFREKKKSDDLGTKPEQREFVELFGRYAAEHYLRDKRLARSDGPSLAALAVTRDELSRS